MKFQTFDLIVLIYKMQNNKYLSNEDGSMITDNKKLRSHLEKLLREAQLRMTGLTLPADLKGLNELDTSVDNVLLLMLLKNVDTLKLYHAAEVGMNAFFGLKKLPSIMGKISSTDIPIADDKNPCPHKIRVRRQEEEE